MTSPIVALISGNNIMAAHTIGTKRNHTPTELQSK